MNLSKYNGKYNPVYNKYHTEKSNIEKDKNSYREQHIIFYNSKIWSSLRMITLNEHPLCYLCSKSNLLVSADTVDHCLTFKDTNDPLATDSNNLYSLCSKCHSAVTYYEGFNKLKWLRLYSEGATILDIAAIKYNISRLRYNVDEDGYPL